MDDSKFFDLNDFRDSIAMGLDIEFFLRGVRYNISWDYKPFICTCPDGEAIFYKDTDDLLNNYLVDGIPIRSLWHEIDIYSM